MGTPRCREYSPFLSFSCERYERREEVKNIISGLFIAHRYVLSTLCFRPHPILPVTRLLVPPAMSAPRDVLSVGFSPNTRASGFKVSRFASSPRDFSSSKKYRVLKII